MLDIPRSRLTIHFARSGGPGGQNVNKIESKVEVRFVLSTADWIPPSIRGRLAQIAAGRMNQEGELMISSTRFRSQAQNLNDCLAKLGQLIEAASRRPKRRIPTAPTRGARERRFRVKKARSMKKRSREWRADAE